MVPKGPAYPALKKNWSWLLPCVLISSSLFIWMIFKAYSTSFTHDESLSYIRFVFTSEPFKMGDTNNHMLNSLLMYLSSLLFVVSELSLRAPNLMGYLLYAVFAYKSLLGVRNYEVRVVGFFVLNSFPFILEFFALARGYGIGLGLFMGYLYQLSRFAKDPNPRFLLYALAWVTLSAAAVLTMVYAVAFTGAIAGFWLLAKRPTEGAAQKAKLWMTIGISGCVLAGIYLIGAGLKTSGAFFFGETSLWVVFEKMIKHLLYHHHQFTEVADYILALLLGWIAVALFIQWRRNGISVFWESPMGLYALLLLFVLVAMVAQHIVLEVNYPPPRSMLFVAPLLLLMAVYWLDQMDDPLRKGIAIIIGVLALLNFVNGINTHSYLLWKYDADTKNHYAHIQSGASSRATVTAQMLFRPTLNFYAINNRMPLVSLQESSPNYRSDYVVTLDPLEYRGYEVADSSSSFLLHNTQPLGSWSGAMDLETTGSQPLDDSNLPQEFLVLKNYSFPDTMNHSAMVYIDFHAKAPLLERATAHVVVKSKGPRKDFYYNGVLWYHGQENGTYHFQQGFWLSADYMAGNEVVIYVWNLDKQELHIEDLQISWWSPGSR